MKLTCTEASEGFQCFWEHYPVKQNKMACERLWRTMHLTGDLTAELVEEILHAVERQKKWEKWKRGFIRNPAKWLEEHGWEDEEPPAPQYGRRESGRVTESNHVPTQEPSAEEMARVKELLAKRPANLKGKGATHA